jgi:hypothetical protein
MNPKTIQDYIKQHGLVLATHHPSNGRNPIDGMIPVQLLDYKPAPNKGEHYQFDIYADEHRVHYVSVNRTTEQFRILRNELVPIVSEWYSTSYCYTS